MIFKILCVYFSLLLQVTGRQNVTTSFSTERRKQVVVYQQLMQKMLDYTENRQ